MHLQKRVGFIKKKKKERLNSHFKDPVKIESKLLILIL